MKTGLEEGRLTLHAFIPLGSWRETQVSVFLERLTEDRVFPPHHPLDDHHSGPFGRKGRANSK
jgi:hypothetical protein